MLLTGSDLRVLQIHPTRHCNLRCLHCYSSSAPEEHSALDVNLVNRAVEDAADLGYNMLSVSGGEPLLYRGLADLLRTGRRRGMLNAIVTNGILLSPQKLAEIGALVDVVAISLDGAPETHNRMRNAERAFEHMQQRLEGLRQARLAFGFVFTLTGNNLTELEWAAEYAVEQGAVLLQIHPLERAGRAAGLLAGAAPSDEAIARAWLVVQRLRQMYAGRLHFAFDRLSRQDALKAVRQVTAQPCLRLKNLLPSLVVESDGSVVPLKYGFPRGYTLGNLSSTSLSVMEERWMTRCAPSFLSLWDEAATQLQNARDLFIDVHDQLAVSAAKRIPQLYTLPAASRREQSAACCAR